MPTAFPSRDVIDESLVSQLLGDQFPVWT